MISFYQSYAGLPDRFYAAQDPDLAPNPKLIRLNTGLAEDLSLDVNWLRSKPGLALLAGGPVTGQTQPLAMAYAGHQFGNFVPQLGDGRAVLLGELCHKDGHLYDLHLKGAGKTAFSRGGDGKAVLSAVLREYIISEAMAALGIPTTRALAATTTGETIWREGPEKGAVLARIAASHVRVGTFQYFYARRDNDALQTLVDFVINRHYPDLKESENPPLALLIAVMQKQAELIARWMQVGFIHGVMNTDNMTLSGETIDYGPCAFLDTYEPNKVFSSIDRQGRYAFSNQPGIAHWNLAQLAQCLVPLMAGDEEAVISLAQTTLDGFGDMINLARLQRFALKIGVAKPKAEDQRLIDDLLALMSKHNLDFTVTFQRLDPSAKQPLQPELLEWHHRWQARLHSEDEGTAKAHMKAANPVYIARNHRVEEALDAANNGDPSRFERLLEVVQNPFERRAEYSEYENPPKPDEEIHATFCGT